MQLVTVKADDWRKRTCKVMSQAKPQLDVVRELFHEGRELGFEERGEGPAGHEYAQTLRATLHRSNGWSPSVRYVPVGPINWRFQQRSFLVFLLLVVRVRALVPFFSFNVVDVFKTPCVFFFC